MLLAKITFPHRCRGMSVPIEQRGGLVRRGLTNGLAPGLTTGLAPGLTEGDHDLWENAHDVSEAVLLSVK